jgi:hypothetical protein
MVAVGDERRAIQRSPGARSDERREPVPREADDAGGRERAEIGRRQGIEQADS